MSPLRLVMLWESLWRKPSCTTGMTWICRTWWITSRKRCSGQFHSARVAAFGTVTTIHITHKCSNWSQLAVYWICLSNEPGNHNQRPQSCMPYVCYLGLGEGFPHERLHVTYSSCTLPDSSCGIPLPSAHMQAWVFPWEKPRPAGRTVQSKITFLNINLCSLSPSLSLFLLSSNVVGGTTTQTGLGTCTLIVQMRTPAPSAVLCLTPAALLFLERCVPFLFSLYYQTTIKSTMENY